MTVNLEDLIVEQTRADFYDAGLALATSLGLDVASWQPGDPTRSLYHLESKALANREALMGGYVRSGFLDYATGVWLRILAEQVFDVTVPEATRASTDVTLTNNGGGQYTIAAGDLTVSSSLNNRTYKNTTGGTLYPGPATTLSLTFEADEPGSDSSAGAAEIDTMVTTLLGVTCSNPAAAVGTDEQEEVTTRQQCRDKLSGLSPNGAAGAYAYVARNEDLTGVAGVTRVREYDRPTDGGEVDVYCAKAGGGISGPERTLIEAAILTNCTPLCITPFVATATTTTLAITYQAWIYSSVNKTDAEIQEAIEDALTALFAAIPIGGDIIPPATSGAMYRSAIIATIRAAFPEHCFRVELATPAGDTALTNAQIPVLGTVTATITSVAP